MRAARAGTAVLTAAAFSLSAAVTPAYAAPVPGPSDSPSTPGTPASPASPTKSGSVPLPSTTPTQPQTGAPSVPTTSRGPLGQEPAPATPIPTRPLTQMDSKSCRFFQFNSSVDAVPRHPWFLDRLNMQQAWQIATGKGIKVAVIDTGVSIAGTPYLPPDRFSTYTVAYDNQTEQKAGYDCEHGTNVAALIGAESVPGMPSNFAGIAPDAEVIAIRSLHSSTEPQPYDETIAAIRAAIQIPGMRIINISQAGNFDRADYAAVIQQALDKGIVVVAAAGNRSALEGAAAAYPAAYPGVISVGMTEPDDSAAPNSFFSPYEQVTVGAPGVDMVSVSPSTADWDQQHPADTQIYRFGSVGTADGSKEFSGTSFAAPIVSGVVALMLQQADEQGRHMSPAEVMQRLKDTADPPAGAIPDQQIGWGIVNPVRALTGAAVSAPSQQPSRVPDSANYPQVTRVDEFSRNAAVLVGALVLGGVALAIAAAVAIPAARRRHGRPARPGEQFVTRKD